MHDHVIQAHIHKRVHARTQTLNSAPLFTRIPFSIDPLCARSGGSSVLRSWLPALLGLFIRLPVAATLFKAPQDSCPGSILHLSFPTLVSSALLSLSFFILEMALSLLLSFCLSRFSSPSFPIVYRRQPDARQQGRLYVLPRLSVARLPCFPIYFRILLLATRCDATRLCARNAIRSNRNPDILSWAHTLICARVRSSLTRLYGKKNMIYLIRIYFLIIFD